MTISPKMLQDYRFLFNRLDIQVPLLNKKTSPYINFDNAASTPSFKTVQDSVNEFLMYYSSVHRGTGFKSQLSTHAYEQARRVVLKFFDADPNEHVCIFCKNTTEAINRLSRRFPFTSQRNIVLVSGMEHHSNDLPWRAAAETIHVGLKAPGQLDEDDFDEKLAQYGERLALVTITGASNVTGFLNPIHRLAAKTHAAGAQIFVDCAQMAPHRKVNMRPILDPTHLDFIAISAHKMYAPFGSGALIGRREVFAQGEPDLRGGGAVEIVTLDDVVWSAPPERDEAGSPNTVGAIALAASLRQLEKIGMQAVADHETTLTAYALQKLSSIPIIQIYGDTDPRHAGERLGVIPLQLKGTSHFLAASILGHEFGIGVRSGCFCAHPYILHLLGLSKQEAQEVRERMQAGDRADMPGLIRASFGIYNTVDEIDAFVEALTCIAHRKYQGQYVQDRASGEYHPQGWAPEFESYFAL